MTAHRDACADYQRAMSNGACFITGIVLSSLACLEREAREKDRRIAELERAAGIR